MQRDLFVLTVASLLHDVGKAFHKLGSVDNFDDLIKKLKENYGGSKAHYHVGAALVELAADSVTDNVKKTLLNEIAALIAAHHNYSDNPNPYFNTPPKRFSLRDDFPFQRLRDMLMNADHLASAEGRDNNSKMEKGQEDSRVLKPFYSREDVLEEIRLGKSAQPYLLAPRSYRGLEFSSNVDSGISKALLQHLYKELKQHLRNIPTEEKNEFQMGWVLSLLRILREYLMYVNSYKQSQIPHTSLYVHSLVTAALASSLYEKDKGKKVYFVKIELKHLQDFITNLGFKTYTGAHTSKILRGRSFLIDKITKVITAHLLNKLGKTHANALLITSGKAELLVPLSEDERKMLLDEVLTFQKDLMEEGYRPLEIRIGFVEVNLTSDKQENVKILRESYKKVHLMTGFYSSYHQPRLMRELSEVSTKDKKDAGFCSICGHVTLELEYLEKMPVCKACKKADELGDVLGDIIAGKWKTDNLGYFSLEFQVNKNFYGVRDVFWFRIPKEFYGNLINVLDSHSNIGWFYDLLPSKMEKDLDKLVSDEGLSKAAFVGLDFDNMGTIFSRITKEGLARGVELSHFMEAFSISLVNRVEKKYVLFAGGDDIKFISPLEVTLDGLEKMVSLLKSIQLAKQVLGFSGGIILMNIKSPISISYRDLEERAEKKAKEYKKDYGSNIYLGYIPPHDKTKNYIPLDKIKTFKEKVKTYKEDLDNEAGLLTSSFVYNLYALHDENLAGYISTSDVKGELLQLLNEGYANYMWKKLENKVKDDNWKKQLYFTYRKDYEEGWFFPVSFTSLFILRGEK